MKFAEPFLPRHPWIAALLFGTVATPGGVILAWLAPRPLDAVVAWPLVLLDAWVGPGPNARASEEPTQEATLVRLSALILGIALTWLFYVLVARLVLWRLVAGGADHE